MADAPEERGHRHAGEPAEPPEELPALPGRPPASVLIDQAEDGRVDRDGEPACGSRENASFGIDDLPARRREVDEAKGLPLCRRREVRPAHDLKRPQTQRKETEKRDRDEPDDAYADEEACAAVEIRGRDRDGAHAEAPRNADGAPTGRMGDEVAQRERPGSAWGTSRPLRRTT
jgi:hypothetical protein